MVSKLDEILTRALQVHGESLPKRTPKKDQDLTTDFTNSVKNTREEEFRENSRFKVLVHGFSRGSP
jgi:hypothetical protein